MVDEDHCPEHEDPAGVQDLSQQDPRLCQCGAEEDVQHC